MRVGHWAPLRRVGGSAVCVLSALLGQANAAVPAQCPAAEADAAAPAEPPRLALAIDSANEALVKRHLKQGDDPNACANGASLLSRAATAGQWPIAQALLLAGARVDEPRNASGLTPMMRAAESGEFGIAQKLLELGADARATTPRGESPLHFAAGTAFSDAFTRSREQLDLVRALVRSHGGVNAQTAQGVTPLQIATERGNLPLVVQLLSLGADVNLADQSGRTALAIAHKLERDDLVLRLRHAGAKSDVTGWVSLAQLVEQRRHAELKEVLGKIAPATLNAVQRQNLLTIAILADDAEAITALARWGVDPNAVFEYQEGLDAAPTTPLLFALSQRAGMPLLKTLLEAGADPNRVVAPSIGGTPLAAALIADRYDVAHLLLDAGANAKHVDEASGQTVLMSAVLTADPAQQEKSRPLLVKLLATGAPVDARDAHGLTALHLAAMAGNETAVDLLLQRGADATLLDEKQRSALYYARKVKAKGVIAMLEKPAR